MMATNQPKKPNKERQSIHAKYTESRPETVVNQQKMDEIVLETARMLASQSLGFGMKALDKTKTHLKTMYKKQPKRATAQSGKPLYPVLDQGHLIGKQNREER